jgi:restriction endonuclease S subunit
MAWITKPLASVTARIGGGTPAREKGAYWGGDIPWFTVADLQDVEDIQSLSASREAITTAGLANSAAKLVPQGAVVFSSRVVVGKVGIAQNALATNQDFSTFVPAKNLDGEFLAYFLIKAKGDLRFHQRGATIKGVTTKVLDLLEVPIPPLPEQRRVVVRIKECMERVAEIEELRRHATREARDIEFACFHDALLEGANQRGWPVRTLGEVAKSFRYGTSDKAQVVPVGVPVLRMGNIQRGYLDYADLKYIEMSGAELDRYRLSPGDILINRTNSLELVGKAATFDRADRDWIYASYLVRVEVDRSLVLPEFVTAVINSRIGRQYVLQTARRAIGMVNLNAKEMAKFPMPLPSLAEQKQVVDQLQFARPVAEEMRAAMAEPELAFLRQSILRKAFSGEL